jgi:hypothetical protein
MFINALVSIVLHKLEDDYFLDIEGSDEMIDIKVAIQELKEVNQNQQDLFVNTQKHKREGLKKYKALYAHKFTEKILSILEEDDIVEDVVIGLQQIEDPEDTYYHDGSTADWYSDHEYGESPWEQFMEDGGITGNDVDFVLRDVMYYLDTDPLMSEIAKFNGEDVLSLVNIFDSFVENHNEKIIEKINKDRRVYGYEDAREVIDVGSGFAWYDLEKDACTAEAHNMGHCGNTHEPDKDEGDEVWSLRKVDESNGMQSHMTVVINPNIIEGRRVIKQIKGNGPKTGNNKPSSTYHPAILKLLLGKDNGKYIVDGFYTSKYYGDSTNFHLSDLDESTQKKLHSTRPELFDDLED